MRALSLSAAALCGSPTASAMAASLSNQAANYLVSGEVPMRLGNAHPNIVPYQTFDTRDGHIIIAAGNNSQFLHLCEVLGMEELASKPVFSDNGKRVENRQQLQQILQQALILRTTSEWLPLLELAGVPCGPINNIKEMFSDPQVKHRNLNIEVDGMPLVSNPIKYSRTRLTHEKRPPLLGEDTDSVLGEALGLDASTIARLRDRGIVS